MVAIYLAPAYLAVCAYILFRTIHWIQVLHSIFQNVWVCRGIGLIYFFVVFSILIAFMAPASGFRRFMKLLSNYWLGVLVYTIMTVGIADGLRLLIKYPLKNVAFPGRELLFSNVGTADLHLGYNIGCRHMEKMVDKINAQNPDLVVVAGDIFDNEYEALENPDRLAAILRGIQSKYGVYACYGNHDIQEKILAGFTFGGKEKKESSVKMDEFLEKSGITLLRDEYVLIDDSFYLYGRPDYERPGRGIDERKSPQEITEDLDLSLPVLVIDHEPRELQELADAGVDADLCGHTHDGQLFPGNLTIKLMWENACGYLKKGNMHSIVTSGVGLFGPNMRVGTKSEICDIMMHFNRIK